MQALKSTMSDHFLALILLWTGDYPAQHEVGKFIKHGMLPCRRDKLKGKLHDNNYIFPFIHENAFFVMPLYLHEFSAVFSCN